LPRTHHDAQRIVIAEAQRAAVDPKDARRTAADHLQECARAQTKLLQPANVSKRTNDLANLGNLTGAKGGERGELTHGRTNRSQLRLNLSMSYRLILLNPKSGFNRSRGKNGRHLASFSKTAAFSPV
jgi:hypothetical protein